MVTRKTEFHYEEKDDIMPQSFYIWSGLSDRHIKNVEGVWIVENFRGFAHIRIDMRYDRSQRHFKRIGGVSQRTQSRSFKAR